MPHAEILELIKPDLAPSDICVQAINAQGYGVQLIFSDGHDRGIYPWDYLCGLTS